MISFFLVQTKEQSQLLTTSQRNMSVNNQIQPPDQLYAPISGETANAEWGKGQSGPPTNEATTEMGDHDGPHIGRHEGPKETVTCSMA